MAYRRTSSIFTLFTRSQYPSPVPSFSILQHKVHHPSSNPTPHPLPEKMESFRGRGSGFLFPVDVDSLFTRHYSSSTIGEDSEKIYYINDAAEVLTENTFDAVSVTTQTPIVDEVAIAAADSSFPVAIVQHLIDGIHSFTGFSWCASIALTTILIRSALIPLYFHQLRATTKFSLMRPQLEEIKEQIHNSMDQKDVDECKRRMQQLFTQYGVTPFTPFKGLLIQGPVFISFFFAINNMVEKVPSFKEGGLFWFVDLTTPDPLYIFPVMTALAVLANVELNTQEGMEGNPNAGTLKLFSRIVAVTTVPFTMNFPTAIFFYWITSNLFSLVYGSVVKHPYMKKLIGLPDIPSSDPSAWQTSFSFFGESESKLSDKRRPSSAIIRQRLRILERTVKRRQKNKKM